VTSRLGPDVGQDQIEERVEVFVRSVSSLIAQPWRPEA